MTSQQPVPITGINHIRLDDGQRVLCAALISQCSPCRHEEVNTGRTVLSMYIVTKIGCGYTLVHLIENTFINNSQAGLTKEVLKRCVRLVNLSYGNPYIFLV